jgi:two-component system, NtrC family, sensor histidine kinase HydH
MRLPLKAKLFFIMLLAVLVPVIVTRTFILREQQKNLETAFVRQGKVMFDQIVVTRRWLSKQEGVYVRKNPFTKESPYLKNANTKTIQGDPIILRSPGLVTRELSQLSEKEGLHAFRIISEKPINPDNLPNDWESKSFKVFEKGQPENWDIVKIDGATWFLFMAPIYMEASCHNCHEEQKYTVGEVRGGVSIQFPVGDILAGADASNRNISIGMGLLFASVFILLWVGSRRTVMVPMLNVTSAVTAMSKGDYEIPLKPGSNDELGDLVNAFVNMRSIIKDYNEKLENEVLKRTEEYENMRAHAQKERDFVINLFERMTDGVCVISSETQEVEYINPSLESVFEGNKQSIYGEAFFSDSSSYQEYKENEGSPTVFRKEITAANGAKVFDLLATELINPNGSKSRLFVFRDITDRKLLEKELLDMNKNLEVKIQEQTKVLIEQEKMAAFGEVSAGLAHEIRNPLSAIMSGISLMESGKRTGEEKVRILNLIKQEASRLNNSLTDFLLFARPHTPKKVRVELTSIIKEIIQMVEDDREIKGDVEIVLDLAKMPPVWFDDDALRQVIWNITLNALQAMEEKGKLTFESKELDGGSWSLSVTDTGPGVPDEIRERIFDPFFSNKKEGTGLGLSIVGRIIKMHGGEIECFDAPEGGTVFKITIPGEPLRPNRG